MDPFVSAGQKLLPGDEFIDIQVTSGKMYINGNLVKGGRSGGKLHLEFVKGLHDNPKINGIMLVEGGVEHTHKKTYDEYRQAMYDMQAEKAEARVKAEQFFAEDAYDYEERVDGRGPFNQFLSINYALEGAVCVFLVIFFRVVMST